MFCSFYINTLFTFTLHQFILEETMVKHRTSNRKEIVCKSSCKCSCLRRYKTFMSVYGILSYDKGHSTPNGAKFLRFGHDPSQNLIKICQVVTIYKI